MRTFDASIVALAASTFLKSEDKIDPIDWVSNPDNIVLINDHGDVALFERGVKHIYTGHYLFKSRGRGAIEAGLGFLDEIFNSCYNIEVITGLTPLSNLGARWLSRRIGFKSYGVQHINDKAYEMFIITASEFNSPRSSEAARQKEFNSDE